MAYRDNNRASYEVELLLTENTMTGRVTRVQLLVIEENDRGRESVPGES